MLFIVLHFVVFFHGSHKLIVFIEHLDCQSQLSLSVRKSFRGRMGFEHLRELCSSTNWMPRIIVELLIVFFVNRSWELITSNNEDSLLVAMIELLVKAVSY